MMLGRALPLSFIGETSWRAYSFASFIVSLVLIVAAVTATRGSGKSQAEVLTNTPLGVKSCNVASLKGL